MSLNHQGSRRMCEKHEIKRRKIGGDDAVEAITKVAEMVDLDTE